LSFISVSVVNGQQATQISIFIGPHTRDGFVAVDQGILDSIKDIQAELRRSGDFAIVASGEQAALVLDIVGRRIAGFGLFS
jgi:hypothetical protein